MVHAVVEVLGRADLLRRGWSNAAFLNKGGVEDNGREDSVNVDLADEAIQSGLFWAYARMVQKVGEVLHELAVWGESCPCHWDQAVTHGRAPHVRRQQFQNTFGVNPARCGRCKHRRAPPVSSLNSWAVCCNMRTTDC